MFFGKLKFRLERKIIEGDIINFLLIKLKIKNNRVTLQTKILNSIKLDVDSGVGEITKFLVWEFSYLMFNYTGLSSKLVIPLSQLIYESNYSKKNKEQYEFILRAFSSISESSLSVSDWDKIGFICNANGLFRLSGICRQKSIDHVSERFEKKHNIVNLISMFKVCLDMGDYKRCNALLSESITISKSEYVRHLYENYHDHEEKNFDNVRADKKNSVFSNIIENKKIAIVAPGLIDINDDVVREINSFDFIILFNYNGNIMDERFNIPCISYYNFEKGLKLKDKFSCFSNDLSYIVFKSGDLEYQKELISKGRAKNVDRNLNEYFFVEKPNMLQIILDDILMYNTREIKVFGANFYLSDNLYYKGYNETGKIQGNDMWRVFAYHNILSQINYVRNIYNINLIELDKSCLDVISMSEEELLITYESIYSNDECV